MVIAIAGLDRGIALSVERADNGSCDLLEVILEEEGHAYWLETPLALLSQIGEPYHLAQQLHG